MSHMAFINDQHHIHLINQGKVNEFAVLVDHYKGLVFTLSYRILKNREEAEEASQDTFIKIFNSLQKFKGDSKFSTWIYKITYNTCLDRLKKSNKENITVYIEDFNAHQVKVIETVFEHIDEKERNEKIQECLLMLPSKEAFLLTLYYFDEQSTEEIAKVIGCKPNNVKIKLFRSRKKLASILEKQLEPEILTYNEGEQR